MAYGTVNADVIGTSVAGSNLGAGNASIMKNRIINGAMMISQRNGTTATSQVNGSYNLDRWNGGSSTSGATTGKYTVAQSSTAPAGFTNSLLVTSSTALAINAADIYYISQIIEGYNISDLAWGSASGKIVTLSFWVQSSVTGTYGGMLRNQNGDYIYPFTYSISSANTWTQITVTIPAPTTGSTWQTDNSQGIYVFFNLQIGTTYGASATGAWQDVSAYTKYGASGCVNLLNTNGATFYITGVQLEVGSSATGYEYRQYGQELALCQRYFEVGNNLINAYGNNANGVFGVAPFKVTKRATPTMTNQGLSYTGLPTLTDLALNSPVPSYADGWSTIQASIFNTAYGTVPSSGMVRYQNYYTASAEL
jgi:hypothetical protein